MYDLMKLRAEMKKIAVEIKDVKGVLRESHQPRLKGTVYNAVTREFTWGHIDLLVRLKRRATQLYVLRAQMRKKIHAPGVELDPNTAAEFEVKAS
jgi:hypothetical protein